MPVTSKAPMKNILDGLGEAAGDAISMHHLQVTSPGMLAAGVLEDWETVSRARTVIVDARSMILSETDAATLCRTATMGVRVVAVAPQPVDGFPPLMVLHESDFARVVVASIYALTPGRAAILISPKPTRDLLGLVRHAMRWRASWRDAEEGDFSTHPG